MRAASALQWSFAAAPNNGFIPTPPLKMKITPASVDDVATESHFCAPMKNAGVQAGVLLSIDIAGSKMPARQCIWSPTKPVRRAQAYRASLLKWAATVDALMPTFATASFNASFDTPNFLLQ